MTLPENQSVDDDLSLEGIDQLMRVTNQKVDEQLCRWQNPKLVAAYKLGFGISALPGFQQGPPPAVDTVRQLISDVSASVDTCSSDLEQNHVAAFMGAADNVRTAIDDLGRRPGGSVAPLELIWRDGDPVCHQLRVAGDKLVRHDRPIRKWFDLGTALGDLYYFASAGAIGGHRFVTCPNIPKGKQNSRRPPVTVNWDRAPVTFELPFEPLLKAILDLPAERLRVMHSLAKLKGVQPQNEIQKIQYLGEAAGFADHDVEVDHPGAMRDVLRYLNVIHCEIEEALRRLFRADALAPARTSAPPSPTPGESKWVVYCFGLQLDDRTSTANREGFQKNQLSPTHYFLLKHLANHGKKYPLKDGIFISADQLKDAWTDAPKVITGEISRLRKIVENQLGLTIASGKGAQRGKYRLELKVLSLRLGNSRSNN